MRIMQEIAPQSILSHIRPGTSVGLVGLGALGTRIRELLEAQPDIRLLLCDPVAAAAEADEISGEFFALWGNGMGGCQLTGEELEAPLLPPERLAAAQTIVLCPLSDTAEEVHFYQREAKLLSAILDAATGSLPQVITPLPAAKLFFPIGQPRCPIHFL